MRNSYGGTWHGVVVRVSFPTVTSDSRVKYAPVRRSVPEGSASHVTCRSSGHLRHRDLPDPPVDQMNPASPKRLTFEPLEIKSRPMRAGVYVLPWKRMVERADESVRVDLLPDGAAPGAVTCRPGWRGHLLRARLNRKVSWSDPRGSCHLMWWSEQVSRASVK